MNLQIRKIIHVDMDAFFVSVEQLDFPELKGKPVAVGGGGERGVVAAASYEARKFGVRSAMSGRLAKQKCPDIIFVKPRFERYSAFSKKIRKIFFEYTDQVEPLSLDEAYLDVTENKKGNPSATLLALEIRNRIFRETGLTASAGISYNKFLAKVASNINKPNGQKTITPEEAPLFLENLPVQKFYGVGRVTAEKMFNLGIFTGKDLKQKTEEFLESHFGKSGAHYYRIVRGIHLSPVKSEREQKSVGAERTFTKNLTSEIFMLEQLQKICVKLHERLHQQKLSGKTITLKIKYSNFETHTRSKTLPYYVSDKSILLENAKDLLYQQKPKESVRLLGISVSNFAQKDKKALAVQLRFDF